MEEAYFDLVAFNQFHIFIPRKVPFRLAVYFLTAIMAQQYGITFATASKNYGRENAKAIYAQSLDPDKDLDTDLIKEGRLSNKENLCLRKQSLV